MKNTITAVNTVQPSGKILPLEFGRPLTIAGDELGEDYLRWRTSIIQCISP